MKANYKLFSYYQQIKKQDVVVQKNTIKKMKVNYKN